MKSGFLATWTDSVLRYNSGHIAKAIPLYFEAPSLSAIDPSRDRLTDKVWPQPALGFGQGPAFTTGVAVQLISTDLAQAKIAGVWMR